jgi:hypothetical protein
MKKEGREEERGVRGRKRGERKKEGLEVHPSMSELNIRRSMSRADSQVIIVIS